MCGIVGWQSRGRGTAGREHLVAMSAAVAHRGPDDAGEYFDTSAGIALGHRRLSIIDLSSAGHQPMSSEDEAVTLVFNGELYNFRDLRTELEALGHRFGSRSDTEVALRALCAWGKGALGRFRGMFALAAYFRDERTVLLARDALGMKPLYYAQGITAIDGTAFASELKAFYSLPGFRAAPNHHSLSQYLEFGYVFDSDATAIAGVAKLRPGHYLEIRNGAASPAVPFAPLPAPARQPGTLDERAARLHEILTEVVDQHLVADVPVGVLLSGGLDSSTIAAMAARRGLVRTFTMAFDQSSVDERRHANLVAAHIGSEHREVVIRHSEISENLEDVVWFFDDLFADWGTVTTRLLYQKCRAEGIKVVLVGEGADELFGGYPTFTAAAKLRGPKYWRLFRLYQRYAGRRHGRHFAEFARIMTGYLDARDGNFFDAVRLFEVLNQLPNNYVMKVDKASMSVGVEARTPYLDYRVASFAMETPQSHLLKDGMDKAVLRRMCQLEAILPAQIYQRPKFGGSIASSWMDEVPQFSAYARSVVLARRGWTARLGLEGAMRDFFEHGRKGHAFPSPFSVLGNVAWRLLLLNLWSRRYLTSEVS